MLNYLDQLTPEQLAAVKFTEGPSLILAGAGSGKTRVLTSKIIHLINGLHINPWNILAITFTNKAANEMKERVEKICAEKTPWMMTFHAFCARILRIEGAHLGLKNNFCIFDEDDAISCIKQCLKEINRESSFKPKSILNAISSAKNENLDEFEYARLARGHFQEVAANAYLLYQQKLQANNAVDFDDLLLLTNKFFAEHPERAEKHQKRFKFILIDEYQDTNCAQYILTKHLSRINKNLTIVGDAAQSIYSWRGADYHNLINFKSDFSNAKIFNLEENFRSTQTILDAANLVIKENKSHPVLNLFTKKSSGEKIDVFGLENEEEEAETVVHLAFLRQKSGGTSAILYRTNAQSRLFEEFCLKNSIPYMLIGGVKFYERREIKDLISYLRLIENPQDEISRMRIEKIGKRKAEKFWEFQQKFNCSSPPSPSLSPLPPTLKLLSSVLSVTNYLSLFNPEDEEDLARLENIKELKTVALKFPKLTDFLENIALLEGTKSNRKLIFDAGVSHGKPLQNPTTPPLILMTLHSAKGLEFDTVFMVGMEEGLFPHQRSLLDNDQLEEERRLCYVGVTRAKRKLYFTYCRSRFFMGSYGTNEKSRFLKSIIKTI